MDSKAVLGDMRALLMRKYLSRDLKLENKPESPEEKTSRQKASSIKPLTENDIWDSPR